MNKGLLVLAGAAALLVPPATPAAAQSRSLEARAEAMLQELMTEPAPAARRATVTRSGTIRIDGTINRQGTFSEPLFCNVRVFYFNDSFRAESKAVPVEFTGGIGKCTVVIPYRWEKISDVGELGAIVNVTNAPPIGSGRLKDAAPEIFRASEQDFDSLDLPDDGAVTVLKFRADL